MKCSIRLIAILALAPLVIGTVFADDGLGRKGGRGGGSSGGSSGGGGGSGGSGGERRDPPPVDRGGNRGGSGGSGGERRDPPPVDRGGNRGGTQGGSAGNAGQRGGGGGGDVGNRDTGARSGGSSGGGQVRVDSPPTRSGPPIMVPPPVRSEREELGRRQGPSRSGTVQYGTNFNRSIEPPTRQAWRETQVPSRVLSSSAITRDAFREDRVIRNRTYRSGYVSYSRGWRDDHFWYPWWSFDWSGYCVLSPFHFYPHLPGFVSHARIRFGDFSIGFSSFRPYRWERPISRGFDWGWQDSRFSPLDWAVNDITEAFESRRISRMDRLFSRRGDVFIETGDGWRYAISSDDFFDMMRDLVESTRTHAYRIVDVRSTREEAIVVAHHDFVDPWGYRERVRHTYLLRQERGGLVIVYFRTDR